MGISCLPALLGLPSWYFSRITFLGELPLALTRKYLQVTQRVTVCSHQRRGTAWLCVLSHASSCWKARLPHRSEPAAHGSGGADRQTDRPAWQLVGSPAHFVLGTWFVPELAGSQRSPKPGVCRNRPGQKPGVKPPAPGLDQTTWVRPGPSPGHLLKWAVLMLCFHRKTGTCGS